ncbi:MAG: ABC transporter ATP-binding protein [Mycobacterium leprae]
MRSPAVDLARVQVQLRGVCKAFRTRRGKLHVLENIDLQVKRGEFMCLLGPSGCGKSTLLGIIAGLLKPDGGEVLMEGEPVTGPGPERVMLFPDGALYPWLTVQGNVEFGLRLQSIDPAAVRERALAALELVRLGKFAQASVHELSPSMRQRAAIARAIAMQPKVLLMDEPFGALDAQSRNVMQEEMQRIWAETGRTVLFVTHNVAEAVRLGDRVAVLSFLPATIKREVTIKHPRPRLMDDPHLLEIRTFLVRDLKADVRAAVQEELGDE